LSVFFSWLGVSFFLFFFLKQSRPRSLALRGEKIHPGPKRQAEPQPEQAGEEQIGCLFLVPLQSAQSTLRKELFFFFFFFLVLGTNETRLEELMTAEGSHDGERSFLFIFLFFFIFFFKQSRPRSLALRGEKNTPPAQEAGRATARGERSFCCCKRHRLVLVPQN
jgi:hypothetical protein